MAQPTAGRPTIPPGTDIDGRYRIDGEPLGSGGMGTVYPGVHGALGRRVAIKVLRADLARRPEIIRRFLREARAGSLLTHPNVVTIHDFGQLADGSLFLAMERIDGRTLGTLLRAEGRLAPARAAHVADQVLCALDEAHAMGVVHRDLKPENIFISPRAGDPDFVKVLDFGLAHVPQGDQPGEPVTATGEVFGTPAYISPEQARGQRCDHRADLYSLGVVLYEMLTGHLPFTAPSGVALLVQHLNTAPPPLRQLAPDLEVSEALEAVVFRALAKDPDERFASATDMRDALRAATGRTWARSAAPPPVAAAAAPAPDTEPEVEPPATVPLIAGPITQPFPPTSGDAPPEPGRERPEAAAPPDSPSREWLEAAPPSVALTSFWRREKRARRLVVAGAAGALAVLAGVVVLWPRAPAEGPAATVEVTPAPPESAPPPAAEVELQLRSDPPGAAVDVQLGGTAAGGPSRRALTTPTSLRVARGAEVDARFALPDHEPHTVHLVAREDRAVEVRLAPAPSSAAPPRPRPVPRPASAPVLDDLK
jgi:serine/threonine-protein kinase